MVRSSDIASRPESAERFEWLSGSLVAFCLACLAITVVAGLVQVRFGSYEMTRTEVLRAVFDADVLMIRGHEAKTSAEFEDTVVSFMQSNDTASELTAVQNGDVYRGGPLYQGPITNLVVTERAARQLYGSEQNLFDRRRVADIVAGEL